MANLISENKNYQNLINDAEGSYLKKDYLEAFLIQSCVIEGVVKNYAQLMLMHEVSQNETLKKKFKNFELARVIDDLILAGKISSETYEKLNSYRKKRNSVIHNLLEYENKEKLDFELKEAYEVGKFMGGFIVDGMTKENEEKPGVTAEELQSQIDSLMKQIIELEPNFADKFSDLK